MKKIYVLIISLLFNLDISTITAQKVTHHEPVAQPDIDKPNLGTPITDPRFGTTLIRLSNARVSGYAGVVPQYSKRQAWNADASRLLLFTGDDPSVRLHDIEEGYYFGDTNLDGVVVWSLDVRYCQLGETDGCNALIATGVPMPVHRSLMSINIDSATLKDKRGRL